MSQFDFGTINPDTKDGTTLASDLGAWRDALNTFHGGASRPSYVQAGMLWRKEVSGTLWELNIYDGSTDIVIANINPSTNVFSLPNDSVGNAAMQANAINTGNIVNLAVTAGKLGADAVTTAKIINLAVTADKLAANAVIRSKIDASAFASGAEIRAGQEGGAIVSPKDLAIAHQELTLPNAASVTPDMHAAVNFTIGQSQNFTVQNPINQVSGRVGLFLFFIASGGPHTISWGANFSSIKGEPLPDILDSGMIIPYYCEFVGSIRLP
ncbi:MAG: hypothetical protein AAFX92_06125 [Pseudomonadota bacterium]